MLHPQQNASRNLFDLSGLWDFQTDPDEAGEGRGFTNALPCPRPLAVPGSWNEQYAEMKAATVLKIFSGNLNPMAAVVAGRIKVGGYLKALSVLKELHYDLP